MFIWMHVCCLRCFLKNISQSLCVWPLLVYCVAHMFCLCHILSLLSEGFCYTGKKFLMGSIREIDWPLSVICFYWLKEVTFRCLHSNANSVTWSFDFALLQSGTEKYVEGRPTVVSVGSGTRDQQWAMVSIVGCRSLNLGVKFFYFCSSKVRSIFTKCPFKCHEGT